MIIGQLIAGGIALFICVKIITGILGLLTREDRNDLKNGIEEFKFKELPKRERYPTQLLLLICIGLTIFIFWVVLDPSIIPDKK
jgi:hypothetical protein